MVYVFKFLEVSTKMLFHHKAVLSYVTVSIYAWMVIYPLVKIFSSYSSMTDNPSFPASVLWSPCEAHFNATTIRAFVAAEMMRTFLLIRRWFSSFFIAVFALKPKGLSKLKLFETLNRAEQFATLRHSVLLDISIDTLFTKTTFGMFHDDIIRFGVI